MYKKFIVDLQKKYIEIGNLIFNNKFKSIVEIKRVFLGIKTEIEATIDSKIFIDSTNKQGLLREELIGNLEREFQKCAETFKRFFWGEFYKLNKTVYPELCEIMIDKNGDLKRVYDNFCGTIAMLDFHGYTKFSNDVKYNKTPLMEFGEGLQGRIESICKKCRSFVYEVEGDALIIIGPENPYFVITAVTMIMETARQAQFEIKAFSTPQQFFGHELKNPMISKFEMNAAVTTGGEVYINSKGSIIGSIIAESSRILKVLNLKKPNISGLLISDKVARNMERLTNEIAYYNIDNSIISNPYLVDVKGLRIKFREIFLENKPYVKICDAYILELYKQLKITNPSKWFNVINIYVKMIIEILKNISLNITYHGAEYKEDGVAYIFEEKLVRWIKRPSPDILREILELINIVYDKSDIVKDAAAIYHDYINDNFNAIVELMENFYYRELDRESNGNRKLKNLMSEYSSEIDKVKTKFFPRRIFETLLSDPKSASLLTDLPYLGKK